MNLYLQGRPASTPPPAKSNSSARRYSDTPIRPHRSAHFRPNVTITRARITHAHPQPVPVIDLNVTERTATPAPPNSPRASPNSPRASSLIDIPSSTSSSHHDAVSPTRVVITPFSDRSCSTPICRAYLTPRPPAASKPITTTTPICRSKTSIKRPHSAHSFHSPSSPHFSYPRLLRERHLSRQQLVTGKTGAVVPKGSSVDGLAASKATVNMLFRETCINRTHVRNEQQVQRKI